MTATSLVWDGWPILRPGDPMPKVSIPNRNYFLLHGMLADFPDWNSRTGALLDDIGAPTPAWFRQPGHSPFVDHHRGYGRRYRQHLLVRVDPRAHDEEGRFEFRSLSSG